MECRLTSGCCSRSRICTRRWIALRDTGNRAHSATQRTLHPAHVLERRHFAHSRRDTAGELVAVKVQVSAVRHRPSLSSACHA
jgi:hypothetical protein